MIFHLIGRFCLCFGLVLGLSDCGSDTASHFKPLSEHVKTQLRQQGLKLGAPLYIRAFKEDSELEVWFAGADGTYSLFKTYPICNWSGTLGPKRAERDRQTPEGFYIVTPAQMNPRSQNDLAFNIGYPNAYDKAYGRTGSAIMMHGGCRSAGCYAMTDSAIEEIFALMHETFAAGHGPVPFHAFPFRMTDDNMLAHSDRWFRFWRNLKQGYDYFQTYRRPPIVGVHNGRYVFFSARDAIAALSGEDTDDKGATTTLRLIRGWQRDADGNIQY